MHTLVHIKPELHFSVLRFYFRMLFGIHGIFVLYFSYDEGKE